MRVLLLPLAALVFLSIGAGVLSRPAAGVGFTVNSTVDAVDADPGDGVCSTEAGDCTLRAAIQETNALSGSDEITVPAGTYLLAIVGSDEDLSASGDLDITDDLLIAGAGRDETVIDGAGLDRVLQIGPRGGLEEIVVARVSSLTIRNGSAGIDSPPGGGITNWGMTTLEFMRISGNTSFGGGGGIVNNETLFISDVVLEGNSGGGVGGGGLLTSAAFGSGKVTIRDSEIRNNTGVEGGGIYQLYGRLDVSGNSIHSNATTGPIGAGGGGILVRGGEAHISSSSIHGNTANRGGGITVSSTPEFGASLELADSSLSGNVAEDGAGGLENGGAETTLRNVTITHNRAGRPGWISGQVGGLINGTGTLVGDNVEVSENEAIGSGDGGVRNYGDMTLKDSMVGRNIGVGILNIEGAELTLERVAVVDNASARNGGGIYNEGRLVGSSLNVLRNTAGPSYTNGGGIYNFLGGSAELRDLTVAYNSATSDGGGIQNEFGATLAVTNGTISGNTADSAGGGIGQDFGGNVKLVNVTIANNDAPAGSAVSNDARGGSITVANTILAGTGPGGTCDGAVGSLGHNLSDDATCGLDAARDIRNADPMLLPLGDYGGPTRTHALPPGSPAIDAGDNAVCPSVDQRGEPRPLDGDHNGTAGCDIGAYEAPGEAASTPTPVPTPGPTPVTLPKTGGRPWANPGRSRSPARRARGAILRSSSGGAVLRGRDLLSITDFSPGEIDRLLRTAMALKDAGQQQTLAGKTLALVFEKPSLRTRVSFHVAMKHLGGDCIYLSPPEVGLGQRESPADVARVLSRYVDCIAARTFTQETVAELAAHSRAPVINALSDHEHPCQALADLLTVREKKGGLSGVTLAFIGDGNNVANSLSMAAGMSGMHFRIASPPGYEIMDEIAEKAERFAAESGGSFRQMTEPAEAVDGADVVYTDVWASMGQEREAAVRKEDFSGYTVDARLMGRARPDAIFMHDLPAHRGEEVTDEVIDGPQSAAFDQAENRMHAQKALLALILGEERD